MSEIPTTSPIEWLVRVLVLAFALMFAGIEQGAHPPVVEPPPGEPAPYRAMTVIETVDALVMESFPMQVTLHVTGYQPDGCDFPVIVEQWRDGNTIFVDIFREIPANVRCAAAIVPYEGDIRLEGEFVNENYMVRVNTTFALPLNLGSQPATQKVLHGVDRIEVGKYPTVAAYPSSLYLTVNSTIGGCDFPTQSSQRREGNTVYVEIYREIPENQACPAIAKFVEDEIALDGGFDPGTYIFNVNGVEVTYSN